MSGMSSGLAEEPVVQAWIEVKRLNGTIQVVPYCRSEQALTINYELASEKSGRSGTSRSRQSGKVALQAGVDTSLSQQQIGVTKQDRYQLILKIFSQGRLIARDEMTFPDNQNTVERKNL